MMKYFLLIVAFYTFLNCSIGHESYGNEGKVTATEAFSDYSLLELDVYNTKERIRSISSIKKSVIRIRKSVDEYKIDAKTVEKINESTKLLNIYFKTLSTKDKNNYNFQSFSLIDSFKKEQLKLVKMFQNVTVEFEIHEDPIVNFLKSDLNNFFIQLDAEFTQRTNRWQNSLSSSHSKDGIPNQIESFDSFCELLSEDYYKQSLHSTINNFDAKLDDKINYYNNELKIKEGKISSLAKEIEKRQNPMVTGIIVTIIGTISGVFISWLVVFIRNKIDENKIVNFLRNSEISKNYKLRSTHYLASQLNMTENRINQICSHSAKISRNSKKKETWQLSI